jgi:hypothetical protein
MTQGGDFVQDSAGWVDMVAVFHMEPVGLWTVAVAGAAFSTLIAWASGRYGRRTVFGITGALAFALVAYGAIPLLSVVRDVGPVWSLIFGLFALSGAVPLFGASVAVMLSRSARPEAALWRHAAFGFIAFVILAGLVVMISLLSLGGHV